MGTIAVVASKIGSEVSPEENPQTTVVYAFAGVFQASLGLLRYSNFNHIDHFLEQFYNLFIEYIIVQPF